MISPKRNRKHIISVETEMICFLFDCFQAENVQDTTFPFQSSAITNRAAMIIATQRFCVLLIVDRRTTRPPQCTEYIPFISQHQQQLRKKSCEKNTNCHPNRGDLLTRGLDNSLCPLAVIIQHFRFQLQRRPSRPEISAAILIRTKPAHTGKRQTNSTQQESSIAAPTQRSCDIRTNDTHNAHNQERNQADYHAYRKASDHIFYHTIAPF